MIINIESDFFIRGREREQKIRIVTGFIFGHSIQIMMTHEKKF